MQKNIFESGFQILLEADYGSHLGISDDEFIKEGCKIEKKENILNQFRYNFTARFDEEKI